MLHRDGPSLQIETASLINPKCDAMGFSALDNARQNYHKNTIAILRTLIDGGFDMVVIEVPCFTQSSKSAMLIGMCWGAICDFDSVLIEPSALKRWSDSKSGDKKSMVKEKVLSRVTLTAKAASDDNIVDAVGIALMTSDLISLVNHESHTSTN